MIRREAGFTLVELLITMVIFIFVIAAGSQIFTGMLTQFKQQSKIAETNIEGIVGLSILRQDIEHAGYGLPWNVTGVVDTDGDGNFWEHLPNYSEAAPTGSIPDPASFNDATRNIDGDGYVGEAPRAILSGNNVGFNGSDYLVIKSVNVSRSVTAQKWTNLKVGDVKTTWTPDCENVNKTQSCTTNNNVRVIVISPGNTSANRGSLVVSGGAFFTQYNNTAGFAPADSTETRIIYGVSSSTDLRMPFNRADYFISNANVPQRCAPNTGVLEKVVVNQGDGGLTNFLPLLDCAADMQVIYRIDTNNDGTIDSNTDNIATLTDTNGNGVIDAQEIREQIKEVRVYILAHEGQYDRNYTYPNASITVGEFGLGSTFNLATTIGANWQNYRWKLYTIAVKPNNLR